MFDQGHLESSCPEYSLQAPVSSRPATSQAVLFRRSRPRSSAILQRQQGSSKQAKLGVQKDRQLKLSRGNSHSSKSCPQALQDAFSCMLPSQLTPQPDTALDAQQQQLLALLHQRVHSYATEQEQQQRTCNAGALSHRSNTQAEAAPAALATTSVHSMSQQQQQQQQQEQQLPRHESLESTSTAVLHGAFEAAVAPNPPLAVAAVVSRLLISVGARHVSQEFAAQLKDRVMGTLMQAAGAAEAAGRAFAPEEVLLQMIPEMKAAVIRAWNEKKAHKRAAEDAPDLTPEQQYRVTALKAAMAVRAAVAAAAAAATLAGGTVGSTAGGTAASRAGAIAAGTGGITAGCTVGITAGGTVGATTTSPQSQQTEEQGEN